MKNGTIVNNRYQILSKIKDGGMGSVYKVSDLNLMPSVMVLKQLRIKNIAPNQANDYKKSFKREVNLLAVLKHPHLPRVTDSFIQEDDCFLVMELIEGQDLEEQINRDFAEKEIINIAIQICELLIYLHSQNPPVIYRDIKPANIMIDHHNQVKLIDFGIARRLTDQNLNLKQTIIGTPGFAPIEQYQGRADHRSDIYALGMTLYNLITKKLPTDPLSIKPINQFPNLKINPALSAIIEKAIDSRIRYRYQSATEIKKDLEKILNSTNSTSIEIISPEPVDYYQKIIDYLHNEYKSYSGNDSNQNYIRNMVHDIKQLYSRPGTKAEGLKKLQRIFYINNPANFSDEVIYEIKWYQCHIFAQERKYKKALAGFRKILKKKPSDEIYDLISQLEVKIQQSSTLTTKKIIYSVFKFFQWFIAPLFLSSIFTNSGVILMIISMGLLQYHGIPNPIWGDKKENEKNHNACIADIFISLGFLSILKYIIPWLL